MHATCWRMGSPWGGGGVPGVWHPGPTARTHSLLQNKLSNFMRKLCNVSIVTLLCLAVALAAPDASATALTVTGATGVCLVGYIIPVVSHLM